MYVSISQMGCHVHIFDLELIDFICATVEKVGKHEFKRLAQLSGVAAAVLRQHIVMKNWLATLIQTKMCIHVVPITRYDRRCCRGWF